MKAPIVKQRYLYRFSFIIILSILQCTTLPFFDTGKDEKMYRDLTVKNRHLTDEVAILNRRVSSLEKDMTLMRKRNFSLLLTGDILLASSANDAMKTTGSDYPFRKISAFIENYDLVFANLETPITANHNPADNKPYVFRLNPLLSSCLRDIKLDVVSLSNNHIMDHGVEGMTETIVYLNDMGIRYTGAGMNLEESRRPAVFHLGALDLYILAYCERPPTDFYAGDKKPGTAPLVIEQIEEDIKKYKKEDSIVLVSLHWGIELTRIPRKYQRDLARKIIEAGADGIIGHHPHWPQGIEVYRHKPVIYSLGNFVNGFYNEEDKEKDNIFVALHYSGGSLTGIEVIPVAGKNTVIQFQPVILEGEEAQFQLKAIQYRSRPLGTRMYISGDRGYIRP